MPAIRKAIGAKTLAPRLLTAAERLQYEGFLRRRHTNRMVRQMAGDGVPIRRIVRQTVRIPRHPAIRSTSIRPGIP